MVITQCSECGGKVSTKAETCPHCGTTDALDDALEWKQATANRRRPELRELGWVAMKEVESVTRRSNLWTLYTSPKGRISRKTYWLWFFLPFAVLNMLSGFLSSQDAVPVILVILMVPLGIMGLLMWWAGLVVGVKRLHDRDKTGKHVLALVGSFFPAVIISGALFYDWFGGGAGPEQMGIVEEIFKVLLSAGPIVVWFLYFMYLSIVSGFLRGTYGPNRYGPDPLQGSAGD